jgi:hypothetical protein
MPIEEKYIMKIKFLCAFLKKFSTSIIGAQNIVGEYQIKTSK